VTLFFLIVFVSVLLQRMLELGLAKRNARYIRSVGGYEVGAEHYKYIVGLHVLFFVSLAVEVRAGEQVLSGWWWLPFSLFLAAQFVRYWCIRTLGPHWNTRIFVLPGAPLVARGPYRYLRHPNYWVVVVELATLPLTFSAYYTALVFSFCNLWLLWRVRIPLEEKALYEKIPE
jgi:methyltransferase